MPDLPKLDHTVINVRFRMDEAADAFRDLGFHLTDRGYHTLGSINHLMMFGTDYLELIGLPDDSEPAKAGRPDIANAPYGINGLVFKTDDVDETFAHLNAIGMAGDPPKAFSRPVELPEGTFDACFRTVHVRHDVFPGGRVYFCEHGTPELVWRPEWQSHQNGVTAMPEFVVASAEHTTEADRMAKLLRSDVGGSADRLSVGVDGAKISFLSPAAYRERYGELASDMGERPSIFGALVMQVRDLGVLRGRSAISNVAIADETNRIIIRQEEFDSVIEFVA